MDDLNRNVLESCENGEWINYHKVKTESWHRAIFVPYPTTWLRTCQLCGLVSTPKRIQFRSRVFNWNLEPGDNPANAKDTLCMKCFNKVRPLAKKIEQYKETKKLIAKFERERLKCQRRLQQQAI